MLLLACGHAAYARDYAVELIIFERPNAPNEAKEVWNFSSERLVSRLRKMHNLADQAIVYETLPELDSADTRYKIMPALSNLAVISNNLVAAGYRILHAANWIQPAAAYQHAPLISFGAADSLLPYGFIKVYKTTLIFADINVQYSPLTLTGFTDANTVSIPRINTDANEGLSVTNTDRANTNGAKANTVETISEPQQPHFFISEKRRLKFKEIHYFDHPLFGVIIGVWSSEQSEQSEQ